MAPVAPVSAAAAAAAGAAPRLSALRATALLRAGAGEQMPGWASSSTSSALLPNAAAPLLPPIGAAVGAGWGRAVPPCDGLMAAASAAVAAAAAIGIASAASVLGRRRRQWRGNLGSGLTSLSATKFSDVFKDAPTTATKQWKPLPSEGRRIARPKDIRAEERRLEEEEKRKNQEGFDRAMRSKERSYKEMIELAGRTKYQPEIRSSEFTALPEGVKPEDMLDKHELLALEARTIQLTTLNSMLAQKHKKNGRRNIAPKMLMGGRPANPWRDRFMLCKDCEHRQDYKNLLPDPDCTNSTIIELDPCAPFTKANCATVSCETAQKVREGHWVFRDTWGQLQWSESDEHKPEGCFLFQVCARCRKQNIHENRKFLTCDHCEAIHYCSDLCKAADHLRHKASCTKPEFPFRTVWGVRPELRKARKEIWAQHRRWAAKDLMSHRIAWLPDPNAEAKRLATGKKITLSLPGFGTEKFLPAPDEREAVTKDGAIVYMPMPSEARHRVLEEKFSNYTKNQAKDYNFLRMMGMGAREYNEKSIDAYKSFDRQQYEELEALERKQLMTTEEAAWLDGSTSQGTGASLTPGKGVHEDVMLRRVDPKLRAATSAGAAAQKPRIRLNLGALDRLQLAAENAPKVRPAEAAPLWEEMVAEDAKEWDEKEVGIRPVATGPRIKEKGVVPRQSSIDTQFRKLGIQLSPAELDRQKVFEKLAEKPGSREVKPSVSLFKQTRDQPIQQNRFS